VLRRQRRTCGEILAVLFGVPSAIAGVVSPTLGGIIDGVGTLASGAVLAPYSREQEREADRFGVDLAARAGWDPMGLPSMLRTLERDQALAGSDPSRVSFFANHPATPDRVKDTSAAAQTLTRGTARSIAATRPAFLAQIDGLVVGPDPASGVFVGSTFEHPDLGFALEMPAGWKAKNTAAAAIAMPPNGRAAVALVVVAEDDDPVEGAREDGLDDKLVRQLTRQTISGLPAVQLIAQDRDTHAPHVDRVPASHLQGESIEGGIKVSLANTPPATKCLICRLEYGEDLDSMIAVLLHLLRLLPFLVGGHRQLALENVALRHQLAVYKRTVIRPRLRLTDRFFWIALARVCQGGDGPS
jgi:Peptidase family M48